MTALPGIPTYTGECKQCGRTFQFQRPAAFAGYPLPKLCPTCTRQAVPKEQMRQQIVVSRRLLEWMQRAPSARVAVHRDRWAELQPATPVAGPKEETAGE